MSMSLLVRRPRAVIGAVACVAVIVVSMPAHAAKPSCNRKGSCSTAPTISFTSPANGSSLAGVVTMSGTSSSSTTITAVQTSVDGQAWTTASGTTTWSSSLDTRGYADGAHTLYARATDSSGAASTAALSVSFANAAPTVSISSPAAGSTVAGAVTVAGSAADAAGLSRVDVQVDGGTWQQATGTTSWSWSWNSSGAANGTHTLTARATDTSGNTATTSATVNVSNSAADTAPPSVTISSPSSGATVSGTTTVTGSASDNVSVTKIDVQVDGGTWQAASGTTSWSYALVTTSLSNGSHTVTARATDSAGNASTTSVSVNVSNTTTPTSAPNTQGSWTSPEGVTINVNTTGSWTISQIYSLLKANAIDLNVVGPDLTVDVQDTYGNQTSASAVQMGSTYSGYTATIMLYGAGSALAQQPNASIAHEYGHAWSLYYYYLGHGASWTSYAQARWTTADGSLNLATDSRTDSSYSWQTREIIADDYRFLFASAAAVSERPTHLNPDIPDPRNVPGLKDFLYTQWR